MKNFVVLGVLCVFACDQDNTSPIADVDQGNFVDQSSFVDTCHDDNCEEIVVTCGDGVVNGTEQCDGSDLAGSTCETLGYVGGSLSCKASCEYNLGGCDSDGDGISDAVETRASTDPQDPYSWPDFVWPNRIAAWEADGIVATGWSVGEVPDNLELVDQFGNSISLHQLYGYVVLLNIGGMWCPPCRVAAESADEHWKTHRADGVIYVDALVENVFAEPTTLPNLEAWVDAFGITYPVASLADPTEISIVQGFVSAFPTWVLLDRRMQVVKTFEGLQEAEISAEIDVLVSR